MSQSNKSGYLPSLDGWRAVSIVGVLLAHDFPHPRIASMQALGPLGVTVFFAISGVLMTWRIQTEEAAVGFFDVKSFYVRRLFRIQPAMLWYLAVVALLMAVQVVPDARHYWFGALFSFRNFQMHASSYAPATDHGWFTGHFWSLSVEEHFYIGLSLFFLLVKRRRALVMGLIFAILLSAQHLAMTRGHGAPAASPWETWWQLRLLVLPAALSLVAQAPQGKHFARRFLRPWIVFVVSALLVVLPYARHASLRGSSVSGMVYSQYMTVSCLFGLWVIATMLHPRSVTTRILELSPLRFLGRLSYSIYLWQQLFFWYQPSEAGVTWKPLVWMASQPVHYLFTLAAAMLSYHFVEKPMIRLGHRLAPPATAGHSDLRVQEAAG